MSNEDRGALGDRGLMMAGDGQTTAQGVVQAATIP